jgi:hypothetical protein
MDFLTVAHATQEVHDSNGGLAREIQLARMSHEHGLVFQNQGNRHGNLEPTVSKQLQKAEGSLPVWTATPRRERCYRAQQAFL